MANFVALVDPNRDRRERFLGTIQPLLALVEGLVIGRCGSDNFTAVWAASPRAPVSHVADAAGAAVIWGDAIPGPGPERMDATALRALWADIRSAQALDGFHAAVVYDVNRGLLVGTDPLGVFPVYYGSAGPAVLVGSSPELFRHHLLFREEFNPIGLAGILLTMHLVGGETLLQGVRRLAAGHLLSWKQGGGLREVGHYELPVSTRHFDLPFSAQVERLGEALEEAVARHAPPSAPHGLLLSGGRDSRALAGFLARQRGEVAALTLGERRDFEMHCALGVARVLRFEHQPREIAVDGYARYAASSARWEQLAGGFNGIMFWDIQAHLRQLPPKVVAGYLMDAIVGGSHVDWAYAPETGSMNFEAFFRRSNAYGIAPERLQGLLREPVFKDAAHEVLGRLRATYESYSPYEFQRAWCFDLQHRQRLNIGSNAWMMSFGSWPVLPAVDRQVLEWAGGVPAATLAERHAQDDFLISKFPELAELPLDRNAVDTTALRPRLRHLVLGSAKRRFGGWLPRRATRERRHYFRLYDINGPGWLEVRRLAEPHREAAQEFFRPEELQEIVPPPEVPVQCRDGIAGPSGMKSLLGFWLWLGQHH